MSENAVRLCTVRVTLEGPLQTQARVLSPQLQVTSAPPSRLFILSRHRLHVLSLHPF